MKNIFRIKWQTIKRKIFYSLLVIFTFSGCKEEIPSPEALYSKYKSSIVLIESTYYLKIILDNEIELFYVMTPDGPEIVFDESIAINNPFSSTGTGFFISEKGEIATNRHVAYPNLEEDNIQLELKDLKSDLFETAQSLKKEASEILDYYIDKKAYLSDEELEDLNIKYKEATSYSEAFYELSNFNLENINIEIERLFLGVTFDGKNLKEEMAFLPCQLKLKSEEVDLAVIQLNEEKTPDFVKNFFSISELSNYNISPRINDAISIIGFNSGYILADTENGIKSQMTDGKITQEPQSTKILYSIPILAGSSGSPVLDKYGNIIAVNYAKLRGSQQGFNFGVPIKNLLKLYYGSNIPELKERNKISDDVKFAYKFERYYNN